METGISEASKRVSIFSFATQGGMKSEIIKYQALVKSIKPLDQRKDAKGKDTFVLSDWWRCNSGELPHFAFVLRAVLTNAPNSCPPA